MPNRGRMVKAQTRADVSVKVDAKLKKQWDALLAAVESAESRGASAFDEMWEAAAKIVDHDPPLYVVGGYATARDFFRAVLHVEERVARRMIRVARFATPAEEERYGTAILDAALGYLEATVGHALDGALPVAFERLKVPVKRDGHASRVSLDQATVVEVQSAARAARKAPAATASSAARKALLAALAKNRALADVRVSEANGFASFVHVPLAALGGFREALLGVKWSPAPAAKRATKKKAKRG